jgi:hypothetical protein
MQDSAVRRQQLSGASANYRTAESIQFAHMSASKRERIISAINARRRQARKEARERREEATRIRRQISPQLEGIDRGEARTPQPGFRESGV